MEEKWDHESTPHSSLEEDEEDGSIFIRRTEEWIFFFAAKGCLRKGEPVEG